MDFRQLWPVSDWPRPVMASRALSVTAAAAPTVLRTPGLAGVCGCGRVGADFFAAAICSPSLTISCGVRVSRTLGHTTSCSYAMCSRPSSITCATKLLELRLVGRHAVQPGQYLLGRLLLCHRVIGQPVTARHLIPHRGPEELFLDRLVPRLRDHQFGDQFTAATKVVRVAAGDRFRVPLQPAEHAEHLFVVVVQEFDGVHAVLPMANVDGPYLSCATRGNAR